MDFGLLPNGRKIIWVGQRDLRIAVALGGGHIAAVDLPGFSARDNPFWQPPWSSHEPEDVTEALVEAEYGGPPEGRLLASILGHSLALDLYGPPSAEEAAAGAVTHGSPGVLPWKWDASDDGAVTGACHDGLAQLRFSRRMQVIGNCVAVEERVENLCPWDRPIAWQQHVSFGARFCEEGFWSTSNCDRGSTHPQSFGAGAGLVPGQETSWPTAPLRTGGSRDYRGPLAGAATANDFTGFRIRPSDLLGYFVAGNRLSRLSLLYLWPRHFFPWLGIWDERSARTRNPWGGRTSVRAYEFGASPFPDSRRELLRRATLFGLPTYLVLPAAGTHWVKYLIAVFTGVRESASIQMSAGTATLVSEDGEIGRIAVAGRCDSSTRPEMESR